SSSLVDGILLYDLEEDSLAFREFERAGIPYVCVGKILSLENYNYVASDHGKAMKDVLEYFYNLEHKKVAIVTEGKSNSVVQTVRSTAFNEFMSERKEEKLDYSYIRINQNESSSDIKLLFNELLNPANRPTAVGIISCFMNQFMDVVKGYGIRIPEDLSVMILEYYKNSNVDEEYQDFTCVESKAEKVTRIAMKKLVKLIDSGKPFESELVGLKVCVKNSTSKPKKRGGRKL
ncbi:substrate-binding domain-containing protein, partial [Enterocloster bolteae]